MRKVRAAICFSSLLLSGAEQTGGAEYGQQNGSAPYDSRKCRVVIGYHGRLFLNGGGSAVQAVGRRFQFGPSRRLFDRPLQSVGIGRSDPRERPGDQQRQECDRRKGLSESPSSGGACPTDTVQQFGLITLHDPNFAMAYCDRLFMLKQGNIVGELDMRAANRDEVQQKLSLIYGNIDIVENNGSFLMGRAK